MATKKKSPKRQHNNDSEFGSDAISQRHKKINQILLVIGIIAVILILFFSTQGQSFTAKFFAPAQAPETCGNGICEAQYMETQTNCCADCTCRDMNDKCIDNRCLSK